MAKHKICSKCGVEKPLDQFHKARDCKFGVRAHCRVCACKYARDYHAANRDAVSERVRGRRANDPEASREYFRRWARENSDKRRSYFLAWRNRNPDNYERSYKGAHTRRQSVPQKRVEASIRAGVHKSLTGMRPEGRTFDLLGYDLSRLMRHLERQFQPGMTWANYGEWHIDHIRPLASFSYEVPADPSSRQLGR